jgi:hypothetical protein
MIASAPASRTVSITAPGSSSPRTAPIARAWSIATTSIFSVSAIPISPGCRDAADHTGAAPAAKGWPGSAQPGPARREPPRGAAPRQDG